MFILLELLVSFILQVTSDLIFSSVHVRVYFRLILSYSSAWTAKNLAIWIWKERKQNFEMEV